ncbi:MAG: aspartyl/glutamyl-tRNA amidotransferase subunit C [Acidobacteriota bacterium]|nr:aspartyl/glutamyl-tRNA amidotransferase subunit C [Acidobacteriota bacterium]MDQ7086871.1 aspartyl/glutamyl-tRNA amidotransferase subunit C [Acidobacteriota bacterium]
MPSIPREQVLHLAALAGLRLEPAEVDSLAVELARMLELGEGLPDRPVGGERPAADPPPFRDDEPRPGLPPGRALAAAPGSEDGFFLVPPVIQRGAR